MLSLKQIESCFQPALHGFKNNMVREYLQYKILDLLFNSPIGPKLRFMGGTCIHIIHGTSRFSEDLDFDNVDVSKEAFQKTATWVKIQLEKEGYPVELETIIRDTVFHYHIKITGMLYEQRISPHKQQKILIKVDTEPQNFRDYIPERFLLNRFDVMTYILAVPVDILLSQKIIAILKRTRSMGKDFYDALFLMGKTEPNYAFLNFKLGIPDKQHLKSALLNKCHALSFNKLAQEITPLIFNLNETKHIKHFTDVIRKKFG